MDSLYTAAHTMLREMVEHGELLFPKPFNDRPATETSAWPEEKKWALKTLDTARKQLIEVQVATKDDGTWDLTRNNAYRFTSVGRKDLAYALMYAVVRALLWLKASELEFQTGGKDDAQIYVM